MKMILWGRKSKSATKDENITDRKDSEEGRQSSSLGWADWQPWWEEKSLQGIGFGPRAECWGDGQVMGRTRAGSAPQRKGGSWPSVCKMARSQASTGNLQGDKYSEISNPFGTSAREKGQDYREHSQDGVIIIPRRIHLPATKANASSTLKWRLAILEQLAIGACCCLWRKSSSQRGSEEGRKSCRLWWR